MFFFFIVDQNVKYHRYLTGSLFKKVTKKLDTAKYKYFFRMALSLDEN
jgi:hypothetical protein